MIRLLKYLLVSKILVASAIGTHMDDTLPMTHFPTLNPMTNFQFQPFQSYPSGMPRVARGRSIQKRKTRKKKKDFQKRSAPQFQYCWSKKSVFFFLSFVSLFLFLLFFSSSCFPSFLSSFLSIFVKNCPSSKTECASISFMLV